MYRCLSFVPVPGHQALINDFSIFLCQRQNVYTYIVNSMNLCINVNGKNLLKDMNNFLEYFLKTQDLGSHSVTASYMNETEEK